MENEERVAKLKGAQDGGVAASGYMVSCGLQGICIGGWRASSWKGQWRSGGSVYAIQRSVGLLILKGGQYGKVSDWSITGSDWCFKIFLWLLCAREVWRWRRTGNIPVGSKRGSRWVSPWGWADTGQGKRGSHLGRRCRGRREWRMD